MLYNRRKTFLPLTKPILGTEEILEIIDTFDSGWITSGPKVELFEKSLCKYNNVPYCLTLNSATTAQEIALQLMNLTKGDEVITTSITWVSTINTIILQGGIPILVDIDSATLNINPKNIEKAITSKTKGIIPVHLAGRPAPMEEIWYIANKYHLWVIEDAAQAMGATYNNKKIGSDPRSNFCIYSFHANKNITTGEGGAIAFHDQKFVNHIKAIRFHGIKPTQNTIKRKYIPKVDVLYPSRKANFTDIQAAIGIHQLNKLDIFKRRRKYLFDRYLSLMQNMTEFTLPKTADQIYGHCYHLFIVHIHPKIAGINRDNFISLLKGENIGTGVHYRPIYTHSFYKKYYNDQNKILKNSLHNSQWSGKRIFSLPLWPGLTEQDQDHIIKTIQYILSTIKK